MTLPEFAKYYNINNDGFLGVNFNTNLLIYDMANGILNNNNSLVLLNPPKKKDNKIYKYKIILSNSDNLNSFINQYDNREFDYYRSRYKVSTKLKSGDLYITFTEVK